MTKRSLARLTSWLVEPLADDVASSVVRLRRQDDVQHVALMPDVHLAQEVCVGAVVGTSRLIFPAAVGSDIGCGMAAVAFDAEASLIADPQFADDLLSGLVTAVPANKHWRADTLPISLSQRLLSAPQLRRLAQRDGRLQLGTLGRGNHFLEFQADGDGRLWAMVHSGSRGMGQHITRHHVEIARRDASRSGLKCLDAETDSGRAYLADVEWARTYARENRLQMLRAVEVLVKGLGDMGVDWTTLIHCDHNHVQSEQHGNDKLWIHRKGAQSAAKDEPGIVPGSMGTPSFHVVGRGCRESLHSCSHGAGRQLSRGLAMRRLNAREFARQMHGVWFDQSRIQRLLDEAPSAYKDIHAVMRAQRDLVKIVRRMTPLLSYKGV